MGLEEEEGFSTELSTEESKVSDVFCFLEVGNCPIMSRLSFELDLLRGRNLSVTGAKGAEELEEFAVSASCCDVAGAPAKYGDLTTEVEGSVFTTLYFES